MKEDIKDAAMNFITGLPLSYEFTVIMVVLDGTLACPHSKAYTVVEIDLL
jgi:hypothetical protein